MGGIKKILDPLGLFTSDKPDPPPEIPPPEPVPAPPPMPDPGNVRSQALSQRAEAKRRRTGRSSTILSDNSEYLG
jgi:hypothetical protein